MSGIHIELNGEALCLDDLRAKLAAAQERAEGPNASSTDKRRAAGLKSRITSTQNETRVDIVHNAHRANCAACVRRLEKRPQLRNAAFNRTLGIAS